VITGWALRKEKGAALDLNLNCGEKQLEWEEGWWNFRWFVGGGGRWIQEWKSAKTTTKKIKTKTKIK
jgi:hypothetical protein